LELMRLEAHEADIRRSDTWDRLGAIVRNMVADTTERRARDHQYFIALAKLPEFWAGDGDK
jgi:hypothetical protein